MKKVLLKTAFVIVVLLLMFVLLVPAQFLLEAIFPDARGRGSDRLLPGIIVLVVCLGAANRITSRLFWYVGLSDKRWSIFSGLSARR
jgi:hypothetical protein